MLGVQDDGSACSACLLIHPPKAVGEGLLAYQSRVSFLNKVTRKALDAAGFTIEKLVRQGAEARAAFGTVSLSAEETRLLTLVQPGGAQWVSVFRRVCPQCLRDGSVGHFSWELLFVDACAKHGNWLVDLCDGCKKPLRWSGTSHLVCKCGYELSALAATAAPVAVVELAKLIQSTVTRTRVGPRIWRALAMPDLQRVIRFLGAYASRSQLQKPQKIPSANRFEVSWSITSAAAEVMFRWPSAFHEVLEHRVATSAGSHDSGKISKTFRGMDHALYKQFSGEQFAFMREEFESFISRRWTGALGKRNRRLNASAISSAEWIAPSRCRSAFGISMKQLQAAIANGAVLSKSRETRVGRTFTVVSRASLVEFTKNEERAENLRALAKRLGVTKRRAAVIVPLLLPSHDMHTNAASAWRIPSALFDDLLAKVGNAPLCSTVPDECVSIGTVLKNYKCNDEQVAALLNEILDGGVHVVARSDQKNGVCAAIVLECAVRRVFGAGNRSDALSIPEAAAALSIKQEVAYHLVRRGLLKPLPDKNQTGGQSLSMDAIAQFGQEFCFARDVSKTLNTTSRALVKRLQERGIQPVCAPWIDGCRQVVYSRRELGESDRASGVGVSPTHL
jgi:hypothetical protein